MQTLLYREELLSHPPPLGCVLCLPGLPGGGSRIHDRSPYGNHGTITGATWKRLPSGLWYLDFDGTDDYINCGTNSSLFPDICTIKAWYRYDAGNDFILTNWHAAAHYPSVAIMFNGGNPILYLSPANLVYFVASANMFDGEWHHFVVNLTGWGQNDIDDATMYVDTVALSMLGSPTKTGSPATKDQCYIGIAGDRDTDGGLALYEMYNRNWSVLEIQNNFNREKHLFGVW